MLNVFIDIKCGIFEREENANQVMICAVSKGMGRSIIFVAEYNKNSVFL